MTDFQATYTECPTCKDAPCLQTRGVGQDDNRWLLRCDSCGTMYWYPKRNPPAMTVAEMNQRHEQKELTEGQWNRSN